VNSLDTNILLYAVNGDCPEHEVCGRLVEGAVRNAESWIIAEQVWFELYRLLRNPAVLAKPLSASRAFGAVEWYRNKSGWLQCAWEPDMMLDLRTIVEKDDFSGRSTFDAVLAVTLKAHGVKTFYTRNRKDFAAFGYFDVIDPLQSL